MTDATEYRKAPTMAMFPFSYPHIPPEVGSVNGALKTKNDTRKRERELIIKKMGYFFLSRTIANIEEINIHKDMKEIGPKL
jgi:hypothetical protein